MKKITIPLIITVFMCISIVGCSKPTKTLSQELLESKEQIINDDIFEFIDEETGVHYWIYSHKAGYAGMGGITPRLNADGTLYTE